VHDISCDAHAQVCAKFSDPYFNVQPRISKTLLKSFLDCNKPLATHYGMMTILKSAFMNLFGTYLYDD
jgi:transcription initiation factor TFIID subunit 6